MPDEGKAEPAATAQRGQSLLFARFTRIRNSILARPAWLIFGRWAKKMTPEELLNQIQDRESFVRFVRALAEERDRAEAIERAEPKKYVLDGASDWKNGDVASFLYGALDYFSEKPFHSPEKAPSWKMFADFLYHGKIIE